MKNIKQITSLQNQEIKDLEKLHDAKYRKQKKQFLAEGVRTCGTLIASGINPAAVYCTDKMKDYAFGLTSQDNIIIVSTSVMNKISTATSASGIVCLFDIPEQESFNKLSSGIVLANISDPGNMGTLIRSAAAMGVESVVIIEGTDPWSPKVVQSSAGTIAQVHIFEISWEQLVKNKKKLSLCALVVSDGKEPHEINFSNTLLVIGNEAHGIPQELLKQCEEQMTIPMSGNVESLNAAVAGSIGLYLAFSK